MVDLEILEKDLLIYNGFMFYTCRELYNLYLGIEIQSEWPHSIQWLA